eukprot:428383-Amphidinium_carterae.1
MFDQTCRWKVRTKRFGKCDCETRSYKTVALWDDSLLSSLVSVNRVPMPWKTAEAKQKIDRSCICLAPVEVSNTSVGLREQATLLLNFSHHLGMRSTRN